MMNNIYIIGAGAYGCALAQVFVEKFNVSILSVNCHISESINSRHVHPFCLSGVELNHSISCCSKYESVKNADLIIVATPVSGIRDVCENLKSVVISDKIPVVLCSKGIEQNTCLFPSEIAGSCIKNPILVLSGPSFADEIATGAPTDVSLAADNFTVASDLSEQLSTSNFGLKPNGDLLGTQVCGAMKNLLAIICGVYAGSGFGNSTISSLITSALQEIGELIEHLGGSKNTVYEPCGVGDVILTCTNSASRNYKLGEFLAQGGHLKEWAGPLAEGALTAESIPQLQERAKYECKIFQEAYRKIFH